MFGQAMRNDEVDDSSEGSTQKAVTDWLMQVISGKKPIELNIKESGQKSAATVSEDAAAETEAHGIASVAEFAASSMPASGLVSGEEIFPAPQVEVGTESMEDHLPAVSDVFLMPGSVAEPVSVPVEQTFTAEDLCGAPVIPIVPVASIAKSPLDEITADDLCWVPKETRLDVISAAATVEETTTQAVEAPPAEVSSPVETASEPSTTDTSTDEKVDIWKSDPRPIPAYEIKGEITAADIARDDALHIVGLTASQPPIELAQTSETTMGEVSEIAPEPPAIAELSPTMPEPSKSAVDEALRGLEAEATVSTTAIEPGLEVEVSPEQAAAQIDAVLSGPESHPEPASEAEPQSPETSENVFAGENVWERADLWKAPENQELESQELEDQQAVAPEADGAGIKEAEVPEPIASAVAVSEVETIEPAVAELTVPAEAAASLPSAEAAETTVEPAVTLDQKTPEDMPLDEKLYSELLPRLEEMKGIEKIRPEGLQTTLKTLMRLGSVLPWVARVSPLLEAAAGREPAAAVALEVRQEVSSLRLTQQEIRTTVEDHSLQLKRMEGQLSRIRESLERSGGEELAQSVESTAKLVRFAGIGLGVLLLVVIIMMWMLLSRH
jgi:hypothetical protein